MTLSATLLSHSTTRAQNRRTAVVSKNETRGGKEPEAAQAQAKGESSSPKAKKARTISEEDETEMPDLSAELQKLDALVRTFLTEVIFWFLRF